MIIYDYHMQPHEVDEADLIDRVSVYGIYIKDDAVLLTRHPVSGNWELPGGGVDEGESHEQTLGRELKEETGLELGEIGEFIKKLEGYFYDLATGQAWRSERYFYYINDVTGDLLADGNGDDSAEAAFVPVAEVSGLQNSGTIEQIIDLGAASVK